MKIQDEKYLKTIIDEFKSLRCTADLSQESLTQLASVSVKRNYSANKYLWSAGDPGDFIAVITSGLIEVTRHTRADEEITMGIFGPSDVIGISAAIKKTTYPGNAKSISKKTEIIKLYLRSLLETKNTNSNEIQTWICEMLLQHEQILRDKIDVTNAGNTENKLFVLLNQLIQRFGTKESHFCYLIPIHLNRSQIGKITGSRVETIIRLLSLWKKQNLITLNTEGIRIENLPLLEKNLEKNGRSK